MTRFATYLHPQVFETSKPLAEIQFAGYSVPHFRQVGEALAQALADYPRLPVRRVDIAQYGRVHTSDYLDKLRRMAAGETLDNPPELSIDCRGYEFCLPGYGYGLGGLFEAIAQMKAGHLERAYVFCLGGHHAYPDWGHGYCLLNPTAVAVRYAQEQGFHKVIILDWDLHHGDGTQAIFAHDPTVYQISIHSAADSLPAFQAALDNLPFQPDILFLFSGYDAHIDDQGKDITNWTNQDYEHLTRLALTLAQKANCPVLSQHGGGYNLPVTVSAAISHVNVLAEYVA